MKQSLPVLLVLLFMIGCGGVEDNYYPLTIGNQWEYSSTTTITTPDSTIQITGARTIEITAETTMDNGIEVFEMVADGTIDTLEFTDTSYVAEHGDQIIKYASKTDTTPSTILVLPIEEGNTWPTSGSWMAVVIGKTTETVVPAGTYEDCWEIATYDTVSIFSDTVFYIYAPEIGLVKSHFTTEDSLDTAESITVLESVTIQ